MSGAKRPQAIRACRSCGLSSGKLMPILSLGELYVSNFVDAAARPDSNLKVPLELVLCDAESGGCGLLQLRHTAPASWMYQQYWYRSGMNASMRKALADVAEKAERFVRLSAEDLVLDVGCNDGTLLRSYRTQGLIRVGFEPASNLVADASRGTDRIIPAYFNPEDFDKAFPGRRAKIITSIAMFYDLEDPHRFTDGIVRSLAPEGIWVLQMSYLPSMLEKNAFDNICHEHLEHYSLTSLQNLLRPHDLQIADVELNDVNGGSFRVTVCRRKEAASFGRTGVEKIRALETSEQAMGLHRPEVYQKFAARVLDVKERLTRFIQDETKGGKVVYVYGASTKGNTLLQFCGLDDRWIRAAAERNPDKWGKRTIGTRIPIVSEEQARADRPDYFLVLPWHFLEEFRQREEAYLRQGGSFIVPLPRPELLTWKGRQPL